MSTKATRPQLLLEVFLCIFPPVARCNSDLIRINRCGRVQDEPDHHRQVLQLHSSQSGHHSSTDLRQEDGASSSGRGEMTTGRQTQRQSGCMRPQIIPLSAVRSWGSDWREHPGWVQSAGCSPAAGSCRDHEARKSLKTSVNYTKHRSSCGSECTHLSSLAMSLCWESSSISGRLVMMSRWTSTGAADTSSMSFVANSCSESQDTGEDLWRKIPGTVNTHRIKMTTLGSTTLSSHLNWFMMMRGILRPPSPTLWKSEKCKKKQNKTNLHKIYLSETSTMTDLSSMNSGSFSSRTFMTEVWARRHTA